jgi:hypothetical protein
MADRASGPEGRDISRSAGAPNAYSGDSVLFFDGADGSRFELFVHEAELRHNGRVYVLDNEQLRQLMKDFALLNANETMSNALRSAVGVPPEQTGRANNGLVKVSRSALRERIRSARAIIAAAPVKVRRTNSSFGLFGTSGEGRIAEPGPGCADLAAMIWREQEIHHAIKTLWRSGLSDIMTDAVEAGRDALGRPRFRLPGLEEWREWRDHIDPVTLAYSQGVGRLLMDQTAKLGYFATEYNAMGCHENAWPSVGAGGFGSLGGGGMLGGAAFRNVSITCHKGWLVVDLPSGPVDYWGDICEVEFNMS